MCRCYACCVNVVLRVGFLYKQSICVLESVSHISCYHPIFHQPFLRVTLLLFSEQLGESPATSNIVTNSSRPRIVATNTTKWEWPRLQTMNDR